MTIQQCRCTNTADFKAVTNEGKETEPGGHYFMQDFVLYLTTPSGQILDRIKLNYCPLCGTKQTIDLEACDGPVEGEVFQ